MIKKTTQKYFILFGACMLSFVFGAFVWHEVELNPITAEIVTEAQKVIGMEFTQAQKDSMLTTLDRQAKIYQELRALKMPNSVVPATNFNPVPIGFVPQDKTNG